MNPNKVYLVQTDTTVGFLSQDNNALCTIKNRDKNKEFLKSISSFSYLKSQVRVPTKFKNLVRRSKNITFIYANNKAFRIVKEKNHYLFIKNFDWMYSTSANLSSKNFDESWAKNNADLIIENKDGFSEKSSSSLIKLYKHKIKKLR
jgi:tRNA A37 threonylcarbamoyladenosine synthetase subunit TsaC/SUA5/YrdC